MSIFYIIPKDGKFAEAVINELTRAGIEVRSERCALLSAFTAMVVANELKAHEPRAIVATRIADAQAAISARNISRSQGVKVVMQVPPCSEPPKGIPHEVRKGVDLWLMPSQRMYDTYPADLRKTVRPFASSFPYSMDDENREPNDENWRKRVYLWVAPIDGNSMRLRKAIRAIDQLPTLSEGQGPELWICGTGKARYAMEAVRENRAMEHPERIKWLSDDYDICELRNVACGIIKGGLDATLLELSMASGKCPLYECRDKKMELCKEFPHGLNSQSCAQEFIAKL